MTTNPAPTETDRIKVIQFQAQQFMNNLQNMTYISNTMVELGASPSAIIYRDTKCCTLKRCFCGNVFPYTTLLNDGVTQKFLFKNVGITTCKVCNDNITKFQTLKGYSLNSYDQYNSSETGTEFVDVVREPGCTYEGCCTAYFDVNMKAMGTLAGIVKYKGCCEDSCCNCCCGEKKEHGEKTRSCCDCKDCCHVLGYCGDIIDNTKTLRYSIYYRECCCSCLPNMGVYNYVIRDPMNNDVGRIEGRGRCIPLCGDTLTYTITFPLDATPELKLTIINAMILLDIIDR